MLQVPLPPMLLQLSELAGGLDVDWGIALGSLSLLAIYLVFRARTDIAEAMGFTQADVALITIGIVAAQTLNVPLAIVGGGVFAVNLGGALVPAILVTRLVRRGTLSLPATAVGAALVAAATWRVVEFDPQRGAVAAAPEFLIPPAIALGYALALGLARPSRAGPLAFASGTLGVLVGADLLLLPDFLEHARTASAGTALVVGGAGAFDLVFLSGAVGLALSLVLAAIATRRPARSRLPRLAAPVRVPDPRAVLDGARALQGLTPRERSLVHLAQANLALSAEYAGRAVAEAHAALDALLQAGAPRLIDRIRDAPEWASVVADLRLIHHRAREAGGRPPPWHEAADTVELAKFVAGALADDAVGESRLGVAR